MTPRNACKTVRDTVAHRLQHVNAEVDKPTRLGLASDNIPIVVSKLFLAIRKEKRRR